MGSVTVGMLGHLFRDRGFFICMDHCTVLNGNMFCCYSSNLKV